jgi:uncharacterized protein (DUF302 family)
MPGQGKVRAYGFIAGGKAMINYGFVKEFKGSFEEAVEKITQSLAKEGFGILTTIDVQAKLKEKLGIDFRKYLILGACAPPSAHKAILAEENIGLMLPCNVIVYEKDDKVMVAAVKPTTAMQMIENERLNEIAGEIESKIQRAMNSI